MERQAGDSIQGFVLLMQGDNPVLLFRACAPTPTPCIDDTVAISFMLIDSTLWKYESGPNSSLKSKKLYLAYLKIIENLWYLPKDQASADVFKMLLIS